jgi:hypothetical protein
MLAKALDQHGDQVDRRKYREYHRLIESTLDEIALTRTLVHGKRNWRRRIGCAARAAQPDPHPGGTPNNERARRVACGTSVRTSNQSFAAGIELRSPHVTAARTRTFSIRW